MCQLCVGYIHEYLDCIDSVVSQTLVRLPPKISEDGFILDFFEVKESDINRPG